MPKDKKKAVSSYFQEKGKGGGVGALLDKIRAAMPDFGGSKDEPPAEEVRKESPVNRKKAKSFMEGFRK